jgi:alkanesulfonate monooxygenase SsuD/methylene tetrahydromethanopterin reductase-like flavin-dependent oxidoreductase (luciferase family)
MEQFPQEKLAREWTTHPWVAEAESRVRFGVAGGGDDWAESRDYAQMVEGLGFDSYWVGDHPIAFRYDCWTHLAMLALLTKRLRLGSLVSCIYYRGPAVLARQVADADAASGGRVVLGLGIGDAPREFAHLGLPFPSVSERQRALTETLDVVPRLLAGDNVSYAGEHVRLQNAQLSVAAVQRPHVPILLAGGGERVTLRQVARYADASNIGPNSVTGGAWTPGDVRRKYAVLGAHCADVGRPTSSVLRTFVNLGFNLVTDGPTGREREQWDGVFHGIDNERFTGTPEEAVDYFSSLVDAGVRYFIIWKGGNVATDGPILRRLAEEVIPAVLERGITHGESR